jgi:tRNA pseudouridine55 synthase
MPKFETPFEQLADEGTVFLLNKPLEWTSFDVVNKLKWNLKKTFSKIKIGHAGTLDPLADGLLIVCCGKKTKTIESIQNQQKTYIAEIFIGATRPSFDRETEIDAHFETPDTSIEKIKSIVHSFVGKQMQFPPIFSAIKQEGKPVYLKARAGKEVVMTAKEIQIYKLEIVDYDFPILKLHIECSKGTYIRSLAHDIGKALNSGAYLQALKRTAIGNYKIDNAWEIEDLIEELKSQKELQPFKN